jgi:hypothetical protein
MLMTLPELKNVQRGALAALIDHAGGPAHLALMLGLSCSTISCWTVRGAISRPGARMVAAHPTLGKTFKLQDLRPELKA